MRKSFDVSTELQAVLDVAALHRQRLEEAFAKLEGRWPTTGEALLELPYEDVASLELLLSRFAKLQDLLGARAFRLVAELTQEPLPEPCTFLDLLNRLERVGAIPSAAGWRHLREIRNDLAHDYPDDPDAAAAALADVAAAVPTLLAFDAAVRAHVARVES